MLLPGGRLWNGPQLRTAASVDDHSGLIDLLRRSQHFDAAGFEEALNATEGAGTLDEAVNIFKESGSERGYLTHISHLMGKHKEVNADLPEGVELASDNLKLNI